MKIGLIGFGSIGQRHYSNLQGFTKDIVILTKRRDVLGIGVVANNWETFVKAGPYDVVFITNETYKHIETVKKCLLLNPRAIFVEKPVSHNMRGVVKLGKAIKKAGISFWVGYNMQFSKPLTYAKKIINSGRLGKIYFLKVFVGQDLREWRQRDYKKVYSAKKRQGGGVVLDLVHDINYPAWILEDELKLIAAVTDKVSDLKIDVEDIAESIFISKKRKVLVTVHQDYICARGGRVFEAVGEKGTLFWNSIEDQLVIKTAKNLTVVPVKEERNEIFKRELKFFFSNLKTGKMFSNFNEALKDMENIMKLKRYAKEK